MAFLDNYELGGVGVRGGGEQPQISDHSIFRHFNDRVILFWKYHLSHCNFKNQMSQCNVHKYIRCSRASKSLNGS